MQSLARATPTRVSAMALLCQREHAPACRYWRRPMGRNVSHAILTRSASSKRPRANYIRIHPRAVDWLQAASTRSLDESAKVPVLIRARASFGSAMWHCTACPAPSSAHTGSRDPKTSGTARIRGVKHLRRLLILSVSAGAGHVRAAQALEAAARATDPPFEATHVDLLTLVPKEFSKLYGEQYLKLVEKLPQLWSYLYAQTDRPTRDSLVGKLKRAAEKLNTRRLDAPDSRAASTPSRGSAIRLALSAR